MRGRRQSKLSLIVVLVVGLVLTVWRYRGVQAEGTPADSAVGTPLVFIHGIKGAMLKSGEGETYWLTPWQILGLGTRPLGLPLLWKNDDEQVRDEVTVGPILEDIRLIPFLLTEPIYGPWLRAARAMGRPFYAFAYDWRRDPIENTKRFEAFLEDVQAKHGGQRIEVVAHSLGGLITLAIVNRRPAMFRRVIFAGVPFTGGIGFLPDVAVGSTTGLNSRILSAAVMGSFPSMYAFLPLDGTGVVDRNLHPIHSDFFSVAEWKKNGWGLFREPGEVAAKEKFLHTALEHAKSFRMSLVPQVTGYPPIWAVLSREHPTLAEVRHTGRSWDFDSRPKLPGDGRVSETQALPPVGIPYQTVFSEADHVGLLNDPKVIALVRTPPAR
jgi:pimeloyl-ACP methyl ester carboxylesterase